MFIPIWVLVLCGFGLPIAGFLIGAIMSAGSLADDDAGTDGGWAMLVQQTHLRAETDNAHARVSDALATKAARIDRALEQITPGANATVKRIASILRGDA